MTSDLVERLRAYALDDHERGCKGREYDCSCGYDAKRDPLLEEAAARIEQLEAEIKTAIRQFEDGNRLECHRTLCTVIYGKQY